MTGGDALWDRDARDDLFQGTGNVVTMRNPARLHSELKWAKEYTAKVKGKDPFDQQLNGLREPTNSFIDRGSDVLAIHDP